jgi:hypothetical protein
MEGFRKSYPVREGTQTARRTHIRQFKWSGVRLPKIPARHNVRMTKYALEGIMTRRLIAGLLVAGAVALSATAAQAQSQQPSISSAWEHTNLSQEDCFSRAKATMDRLNYQRVEKIGNTTFGDRGNFQIGIRCVSEKQMYYVFGGGPGDQDAQLDKYINEMKASFGSR